MPNPNTGIYPNALPTDLDLLVATNKGLSQLTADITSTSTTIPVVNASKFTLPCLIQIDTEIIRANDRSGNNLIGCTRGFDGTNTAIHLQSQFVKGYILAHHHNQITAEIKAICAALGPNLGNVVTIEDEAGGELIGNFFNLALGPNGITAGTYGASDKAPVITIDAAGRISAITLVQSAGTGIRVLPIFYKAAIAQGTNAVLGFSFANDGAPSAVIVNGANQVYAVASFTEGNEYSVQDHFWLPDDWAGTIDLDIYWRSPIAIGAVAWQVQTAGMRAMTNSDITWSPKSSITDLSTTPLGGVNLATIQAINTTDGFGHPVVLPGDEFFFRFSRSATDSMQAAAELIALRFRVRRNWTLGQSSS